MEQFAEYSHAIVALAATALFGLILGPLSALRKSSKGLPPGASPEQDYGDDVYRFNRAYLNLTETMGFFAAVTVAAILAGAAPFWVNLLASVFFVSRLVHAFVHIKGMGKPDTGIRSIIYTIGWACCIVLAILAIVAAF